MEFSSSPTNLPQQPKGFKPSLNDLSLLIGMEEWDEVIKNEGLSQEIVALLTNQQETMKNRRTKKNTTIAGSMDFTKTTMDQTHQQTHGQEGGLDDSTYIQKVEEFQLDTEMTMGKVQFAIMQNLVNKMAEATDYDTSKIEELHRGSVVFREDLQGIVNSSVNIRNRQSEIAFQTPMGQARKTNIPNQLDIDADKWAEEDFEDDLEIPISDKNSDHDENDKDSDLSFEPDESRKRVVLSKSEMEIGSPTLKFPTQEDHLNKDTVKVADEEFGLMPDRDDSTNLKSEENSA